MGVANAAPQIEGAWNEGGKGETIWDRFAMIRPEMIDDRSTPGVACDSYHLWREDLAIIKGLGAQFYRLSIGKVAMVIDTPWFEPGTQKPEDVEAAERALLFIYGLYGHPIYHGAWPQVVKDRVALRSRGEGLKHSRLPEFTPEEKKLIKGTHDYLTLNYYITHMANATAESPFTQRSFFGDMNINEWVQSAIWPTGLRKILNRMKNTYGDHEIVITENGISAPTAVIKDLHRIKYYQHHLSACLDAIYEDKVRLVGYMAWTFMDDWEWLGGYR
nr:unnamed protein product [Callosobruchus analis]